MKDFNELLQIASGHVLTEYLPDNFQDMEEEDQDEFLMDHLTSTYVYWSVRSVWAVIESFADELENIQKSTIKELQND